MTVEQLLLPRLAVSMASGTIVTWLVENGEAVSAGQGLYLLETDKVESQIDAPVSGTLHIYLAAGETYDVGAHLADIRTDD